MKKTTTPGTAISVTASDCGDKDMKATIPDAMGDTINRYYK